MMLFSPMNLSGFPKKMSDIVTFNWDDNWEDDSSYHISHKPNLHKVGIKRGQKTLNNSRPNTSDGVFVSSITYCLTEYPKYARNGIYHLYKINWNGVAYKKGEWVGKQRFSARTYKTDQFKCHEDILEGVRYYAQYKIKNGIAIPYKNGWEDKNIEKRIIKQFRLNNKKLNPEDWTKVLVEIPMSNKKALAENNGKRFYTKRVKRKNLKPRSEAGDRLVDTAKRKKLLELQKKPYKEPQIA